MKKQFVVLVMAVFLISLFVSSCATPAPIIQGCECGCDCSGGKKCSTMDVAALAEKAMEETILTYVLGKEWRLIKVRVEDNFTREVHFDRAALARENLGDLFSLKFDSELISGKAEPNTYTAPYTINETEKTISIMPMRSTLMASTWQPDRLKEHDYFVYMQNALKWDVVNRNLVIFSKTMEGVDVQLTFQ